MDYALVGLATTLFVLLILTHNRSAAADANLKNFVRADLVIATIIFAWVALLYAGPYIFALVRQQVPMQMHFHVRMA